MVKAKQDFTIYTLDCFGRYVMLDRPLADGSSFLIGEDQDFCAALESSWQKPAKRICELTVDGQLLRSLLSPTEKSLAKILLSAQGEPVAQKDIIKQIWRVSWPDVSDKSELSVHISRVNRRLTQGNCGVVVGNREGEGYFMQKVRP